MPYIAEGYVDALRQSQELFGNQRWDFPDKQIKLKKRNKKQKKKKKGRHSTDQSRNTIDIIMNKGI